MGAGVSVQNERKALRKLITELCRRAKTKHLQNQALQEVHTPPNLSELPLNNEQTPSKACNNSSGTPVQANKTPKLRGQKRMAKALEEGGWAERRHNKHWVFERTVTVVAADHHQGQQGQGAGGVSGEGEVEVTGSSESPGEAHLRKRKKRRKSGAAIPRTPRMPAAAVAAASQYWQPSTPKSLSKPIPFAADKTKNKSKTFRQTFVLSSTPSDWRSERNALSTLRRY
jgi:hypothetical protein